MTLRPAIPILFGSSLLMLGCGTTAPPNGPPPDLAMAVSPPDLAPACQHKVPCTDQSVQEMNLFRAANPATITNQAMGDGWASVIDATAGGASSTKAYVYALFTDKGLLRVNVGDEEAFTSSAWDVAFRRFVIRTNSGPSGPACVSAAAAVAGTRFDALKREEAASLEFTAEDYMSPSCAYLADTFGLGSPATRTQSFWKYQGCVQMTGDVFVFKRPDGRLIKATVTAYYDPMIQAQCDKTGAVPMGATGAGKLSLRWAFIP